MQELQASSIVVRHIFPTLPTDHSPNRGWFQLKSSMSTFSLGQEIRPGATHFLPDAYTIARHGAMETASPVISGQTDPEASENRKGLRNDSQCGAHGLAHLVFDMLYPNRIGYSLRLPSASFSWRSMEFRPGDSLHHDDNCPRCFDTAIR